MTSSGCPVPQVRKWNIKFPADFGETNVGDAIFSRQFTKGKLPHFFVQFLPIPWRVLTMHPRTLLRDSLLADYEVDHSAAKNYERATAKNKYKQK